MWKISQLDSTSVDKQNWLDNESTISDPERPAFITSK